MLTRSVRATDEEATRPLPGDELIPSPAGSFTHAITIRRTASEVWPWLAQMGAGSRAGWYSYDVLDNGGQPSAAHIVPELQTLAVGMVFPARPGATDAFTLLAFELERFLVLGWLSSDGSPLATWAFVLHATSGGTRLLARARGGTAYTFHGLPPWISRRIIGLIHTVMQRRQLVGIATRAEPSPGDADPNQKARPQARRRTTEPDSGLRALVLWSAAAGGLAAGAYALSAGLTWYRYGRVPRVQTDERDPQLDRFMPCYDVVDRHRIRVAAPAAVALEAAREIDLFHMPAVRAIVKARELILGATPDHRSHPRGLVAEAQSLGWVVLAEVPGREIIMGAATEPWEANVTFRAIPPEAFRAFDAPNFVKIVWTLRAEPLGERASIFSTETRAVATDAAARVKFRRYWALLSPGIRLIRRFALRPVRRAAERRAHERAAGGGEPVDATEDLRHTRHAGGTRNRQP